MYATIFRERWNGADDNGEFRINQLAEFRIVTVLNEGDTSSVGSKTYYPGPGKQSKLFTLPKGNYIVSEVLALNGYSEGKLSDAMAEIERAWQRIPYTGGPPSSEPLLGTDPRNIKWLSTDRWGTKDPTVFVPVFPHVAKNWAYTNPEIGNATPFDLSKFYLPDWGLCDDATVNKFKTEMSQTDPKGVFQIGASPAFVNRM